MALAISDMQILTLLPGNNVKEIDISTSEEKSGSSAFKFNAHIQNSLRGKAPSNCISVILSFSFIKSYSIMVFYSPKNSYVGMGLHWQAALDIIEEGPIALIQPVHITADSTKETPDYKPLRIPKHSCWLFSIANIGVCA